jgi:hypothetical protein
MSQPATKEEEIAMKTVETKTVETKTVETKTVETKTVETKLGRPQKVLGFYVRDYNPTIHNVKGKLYYAANKEKIKEYKSKKKEDIALQQHAYYERRRAQKMLEEPPMDVICECGRSVSSAGLKNHMKTKLHHKNLVNKVA